MPVRAREIVRIAYLSVAVSLIAQAADLVKPDIKLGLWEVTNNPQISGEMPIPDDQLAKLTPEQRARFQAAMQSGMASAARPRTYRECMTAEKLAKGFSTEKPGDSSYCEKKVVTSSADELQIHEDCNKPGEKTSVDVHFQIQDRTAMTGNIDAVMSSGARSMTMHSKLQGKWLGPDCGAVKDAQLVK